MTQTTGRQQKRVKVKKKQKKMLSQESITFLQELALGYEDLFAYNYTDDALWCPQTDPKIIEESEETRKFYRAERIIKTELLTKEKGKRPFFDTEKWVSFINDGKKADELLLVLNWFYETDHSPWFAFKHTNEMTEKQFTDGLKTLEEELSEYF